ncbi:hypothetical protein ACFYO1_21930 [Nocardia sp. NPDC006044]|uniref:restriction system modified-DNA reader domain-containing protein n=1 Tax=Nocardia sp. NPDC006044 TaxID=3364306 RepID=UPI00369C7C2E
MEHELVVDNEVFEALVAARRGFESPNDVLRRLLLDSSRSQGAAKGVTKQGEPRTGQLAALLERGLIESGDELSHERVRRGQVFVAEVLEDGLLRTTEGVYEAPSPALKALVGSDINGWKNWIHTRSGKTLSQLRDLL